MKKTLLITLFGLLFLSLAFNLIRAADQSWCSGLSVEERSGGLVPCGRSCDDPTTPEDESEPCTLCHFFLMIKKIIDFLLLYIVPPIAILMIAIGGFMYIVAYMSSPETLAGGQKGGPALLSQAKRLFSAVVVGLIIIYGAFLIIGTFFQFIGLADWTENIYQNWWREGFFEIRCD